MLRVHQKDGDLARGQQGDLGGLEGGGGQGGLGCQGLEGRRSDLERQPLCVGTQVDHGRTTTILVSIVLICKRSFEISDSLLHKSSS